MLCSVHICQLLQPPDLHNIHLASSTCHFRIANFEVNLYIYLKVLQQ
jgi:hypothetical protein